MIMIIVLGNANEKIMKKRVDRAVEYYEHAMLLEKFNDDEYREKTFIMMCGGTSGNGLAKNMMKYAVNEHGMDPDIFILEEKSKTTVENLSNAKKIVDIMFPYSSCDYPRIVVCTSKFHIKRSSVVSAFIFGNNRVDYICTNEEISREENDRELRLLDKYLGKILNI